MNANSTFKKSGWRAMTFLISMGWIVTNALSHQFLPLSIDQLVEESHWVVQGRVVEKSCHWDGQGRIFTQIKLDRVDVWKGESTGETFTFIQAGGTLGDIQMVATGEPNYQLREEVVVFLDKNQRGEGVSVGMAQGKFKTWLRESDQELMAFNLFHGAPQMDASTSSAWTLAQAKAQGLTVSELKDRVVHYEK